MDFSLCAASGHVPNSQTFRAKEIRLPWLCATICLGTDSRLPEPAGCGGLVLWVSPPSLRHACTGGLSFPHPLAYTRVGGWHQSCNPSFANGGGQHGRV